MAANEDIKNIIVLTRNMLDQLKALPRPICETSDIEEVTKHLATRQSLIKALFDNYSPDELSAIKQYLDDFAAIDKELVEFATEIKQQMSQQILNQKKNTKAARAYKTP